ncbi:hypothetical protein CAL7102_07721 [Dulcicalothrix desertica PCC 7102]|nr:hypothetical protein CAL7102_07721 [Dulcicalothrix desertica PCC 7102]
MKQKKTCQYLFTIKIQTFDMVRARYEYRKNREHPVFVEILKLHAPRDNNIILNIASYNAHYKYYLPTARYSFKVY